MTDDDHKTYRRRYAPTRVIEPVEVARVYGLRRRIAWRLRELSEAAGRLVSLRRLLEASGYSGSQSSMFHIIKRSERLGTMTKVSFDALTAALRMDEVDGWHRPWPKLPPARERRSLVDIITEDLTGGEPGKG